MEPTEVDLTAELVRELLRDQHPDLADRRLWLGARGWDNQLWRLGADFTDALAAAHDLYSDQISTPGLRSDERRFCLDAGDRLLADFADHAGQTMVLHGDPWRGGNLVATSASPVLLDFEAVCLGPLEWDLSALGEEAAPFGDSRLFAQCLAARSFLVAAHCWAQQGRAPEIDAAAEWHLRLLHQRTSR